MKPKKLLSVTILIIIMFFTLKFITYEYIFPYNFKEYVNKYSEEYNIDPLLVLSIIKCESNFNEHAISTKDAKGLMQIMEFTGQWVASEIGITDFNPNMLFEADLNIQIGCWYISNLYTQFKDLHLAIAAYNGGSGNVTKWLDDTSYSSDGVQLDYIPFKETKKYLDRVVTTYKIYQILYN